MAANNHNGWKSKTDKWQGYVKAKLEDIHNEQIEIKISMKEQQQSTVKKLEDLDSRVHSLEQFRNNIKMAVATIASGVTIVFNLVVMFLKDLIKSKGG